MLPVHHKEIDCTVLPIQGSFLQIPFFAKSSYSLIPSSFIKEFS